MQPCMRRITSFFLLSYLFFQSWTNAFSFHALVPLHVIFGTLSITTFILYVLATKQRIRIGVLQIEDIFVGVLLASLTFAALVHPRETSFNYIAAYTYVFAIGYVGVKVAMYNFISTQSILNWVLLGALVTAFGSIVEFVVEYGIGFDLGPYLFRFKQADALFGQIFPRSMAFSTEPGILAFFLETLGLVSIGIIVSRTWSSLYKAVGITVIVLGWTLAFSAASVAALGISGLVVLSIKWVRTGKIHLQLLPFLIIPLAVTGVMLIIAFARDTLLGDIIVKITLQGGESGSASVRMQRWIEGLQKITERPLLGEGPGTAAASSEISNISWYVFLAVEGGLISLIPAAFFVASKLTRIAKSSLKIKYWFLTGAIAGTIHLAVISTFFNPFLWCLFLTFETIECRLKYKSQNKLSPKLKI